MPDQKRCLQNNYSVGFFPRRAAVKLCKADRNAQIRELGETAEFTLTNFLLRKFPVLWQKSLRVLESTCTIMLLVYAHKPERLQLIPVIATPCLLPGKIACRKSPGAAVFMGHNLSQG